MTSYNLGKGTVLGILERAGVRRRNQGLPTEKLDRAAELYRSRLSLKAVAAEFGCDAETVRKELNRTGVVMRKPWERG